VLAQPAPHGGVPVVRQALVVLVQALVVQALAARRA
jgi:hypothetical protein